MTAVHVIDNEVRGNARDFCGPLHGTGICTRFEHDEYNRSRNSRARVAAEMIDKWIASSNHRQRQEQQCACAAHPCLGCPSLQYPCYARSWRTSYWHVTGTFSTCYCGTPIHASAAATACSISGAVCALNSARSTSGSWCSGRWHQYAKTRFSFESRFDIAPFVADVSRTRQINVQTPAAALAIHDVDAGLRQLSATSSCPVSVGNNTSHRYACTVFP